MINREDITYFSLNSFCIGNTRKIFFMFQHSEGNLHNPLPWLCRECTPELSFFKFSLLYPTQENCSIYLEFSIRLFDCISRK